MESYYIEVKCEGCGTVQEIYYGQFSGFDGNFDAMPRGECLKCSNLIQLDLNTNQYDIITYVD
jgi:hypothetical protein